MLKKQARLRELAFFREWKNACCVGEGWIFREVCNG